MLPLALVELSVQNRSVFSNYPADTMIGRHGRNPARENLNPDSNNLNDVQAFPCSFEVYTETVRDTTKADEARRKNLALAMAKRWAHKKAVIDQ